MKLTKFVLLGMVGAGALVVGVGAGIGVGAAIFLDATTKGANTVNIEELFSAKTNTTPEAQYPTLDAYAATGNLPVVLVTDGGVISDKSFNEQAYEAITGIYSGLPSSPTRIYQQPTSTAAAQISAAYGTVASRLPATGTIIAPGFYHAEAIKDYQEDNAASTLKFVLLDNGPSYTNFGVNPPVTTQLKHTTSITFDTKSAGFQAGYLTGQYLESVGDTTPMVGTWGGGNFPGVTDFMVGFVSGIKYYNANNGGATDVKFVKFNEDTLYVNTGFAPGGGRTNADFLVQNDVDVILPVAGPQTQDALAAIKAAGKTKSVKVIGVDNDQSKSYSEDANMFLTSIRKNVKLASYEGYKISTGSVADRNLILQAGTGTVATSSHYLAGLQGGYTGYVKQFQTSSDAATPEGKWGTLYGAVDALSLSLMTSEMVADWNAALAYIKA